MGGVSRRAAVGGLAGLTLAGLTSSRAARAQGTARIVIVGGGFGGATAARTLRRLMPGASITLIEPEATYWACPFSNLVVGGLRDIGKQGFFYEALKAEGITIAQDRAEDVDATARTVRLGGGAVLPWDRLILAPGIDLRWGALEGYDPAAAERMPHAWKAGVQTTTLWRQIETMREGGLVVMAVPEAPYRCPPGPYERASLIAHYLKTRKPGAKILVLDAKDTFSKQPLFQRAWADLYSGVLEWRGAASDGRVVRVDAGSMQVATDFETFTADVANIIPPQQAGAIARRAGVADATGWCPVNAETFESTLQPGIHVIGDAAIANPMPKSAFAANLHGKVCALQVARLLTGEAPVPTVLANTCYSYIAPDAAVSIAGVYATTGGRFADVPGSGGLSPLEASAGERAAEAAQAEDWFRAVTREAFG